MNDIKIISECENETVMELIELIGIENTALIVKAFSGTQIYIPNFKHLAKEYRDSAIYEDYKKGINYKALGAKYGLTVNAVRNIVAVRRKNEQH